jgi:flavin reductase (DIM6/NTAB) family NADH-FMN oxidoreductase RutF
MTVSCFGVSDGFCSQEGWGYSTGRKLCEVQKMPKKSFPLSKVYRLLEPGPVVLLTTAHKDKADIMTQSWHTMMEFEPPLVGCVIGGRSLSYEMLLKTKECVLNIPTLELAKQVVGIGNCSGRKVDKFRKFKLTALPASQVSAPLIAECYANLECKVVDTRMVNRYGFFVLEVVKAWIDPALKNPRTLHHQGKGVFVVDGERIKLPSKVA